MLENYFPILVFIAIAIFFAVAPVVMGLLLAPHRPDSEKLSPYECGFEAFGDTRLKFDVRYYVISILFILFDLEVAFLVPWASIFGEIVGTESIKWFGFAEMLVFLGVLLVGFIYAWKKGALDWE